jgi:hypothetical protein
MSIERASVLEEFWALNFNAHTHNNNHNDTTPHYTKTQKKKNECSVPNDSLSHCLSVSVSHSVCHSVNHAKKKDEEVEVQSFAD